MAGGHGGKRPGAGRKAGSISKRTQRFRAEVAESGKTMLEYVVGVARDETVDPERRDKMAIAALPYLHPRLQVVDARVVAEVTTTALTDEQRVERARKAIREAFAERTPLVVDGEYRVIAGKANREDKGSG